MDHTLRLYHYLDLIQIYLKQPFCFHNLKTLIYQCSRINGNLLSHCPVGMLQGIFHFYLFQICSLLSTERTTGRSNQQFINLLMMFSVQRLEDGAVFTVHRQDPDIMFFRQRHNNMSGSHQSLFICQGNILACPDCFYGRTDTDHSHNSSYQNFYLWQCGYLNQAIHACYNLHIQITDSCL